MENTIDTLEDMMEMLLVDDDLVELDDNDDLWWALMGSNWVLAGPH